MRRVWYTGETKFWIKKKREEDHWGAMKVLSGRQKTTEKPSQ
jgi:hypothetical protein